MKDRVAKAVFWIVWSRLGLHGVAFLSTLVVVRILSPADYGLMALAGISTYIVSLIVQVDLGSAIIQFPDLDDKELNACFWFTMCLTLLGCGLLMFCSPWIAAWFSAPRLATILPVVALTLPIAGAKVVSYGLLKKGLEFDKISKTEIAASVITIPTMLIMAWSGAGVWALVAGALIPLVVQSIGSFWYVHWRPGLQIKGHRVRQMLNYTVFTTGGNIAWAICAKSPEFILGKVAGESLLGIYSVGMEIATALTKKISIMVQQLAFPVMAELQENLEALRNSMLRGLRLIAVITFPISFGMILLTEDFVNVVLTEKWISVVPVLQVLCIYALYQALFNLFPVILKARYRVTYLLFFNLILLGILPLAFLIGARIGGPVGVAFGWLLYPMITMWLVREVCIEVDLNWNVLWQQISVPSGANSVNEYHGCHHSMVDSA